MYSIYDFTLTNYVLFNISAQAIASFFNVCNEQHDFFSLTSLTIRFIFNAVYHKL